MECPGDVDEFDNLGDPKGDEFVRPDYIFIGTSCIPELLLFKRYFVTTSYTVKPLPFHNAHVNYSKNHHKTNEHKNNKKGQLQSNRMITF